MWIGIPLNGVPFFFAGTVDPDTMQMADADSLPTFSVFEESNTTAIVTGTMVKIATGRYYGTLTLSAGSGFEVGKYYGLVILATKTGSITGNAITSPKTGSFRCTPSEAVLGYSPVDVEEWKGVTAPAMTGDAFALIGTAGVGLSNLGDTRLGFLTGDSFTRIGAAGAGLTALGDTRIAHLDRDISAIFTTVMTESYNADGSAPTPAQALYLILQRLTEFVITTTSISIKKLDGSTQAAVLTLDDATNPTTSHRTA